MRVRSLNVPAALVIFSLITGPAGAARLTAPAPARADIKLGEEVYARCMGCHALAQDRTGPRHCGLFGRKAGSVAGFAYSPAMQHSRIVWTSKTLDMFIKAPMRAVPGTSMGYDGVKDDAERAALIAWLRAANASPACGGTAP